MAKIQKSAPPNTPWGEGEGYDTGNYKTNLPRHKKLVKYLYCFILYFGAL
jgi:hypothetical protein